MHYPVVQNMCQASLASATDPKKVTYRLLMLGQVIRDARKSQGLSQEKLARMARVSRRHLAALESGANVSLQVLSKIARALRLEEIELGDLTLVGSRSRTAANSSGSGNLRERADDSIWTPRAPREEKGGWSRFQVAGGITWNRPIEPAPEGDEAVVPTVMIEPHEILLRVMDDSLRDEGLQAGDLLIVEPRADGHAATGETIVGTLNGRAVVGRWWSKRGARRLLSRKGRDLAIGDSDVFTIHGVVTWTIDLRGPAT